MKFTHTKLTQKIFHQKFSNSPLQRLLLTSSSTRDYCVPLQPKACDLEEIQGEGPYKPAGKITTQRRRQGPVAVVKKSKNQFPKTRENFVGNWRRSWRWVTQPCLRKVTVSHKSFNAKLVVKLGPDVLLESFGLPIVQT